MNSSASCFTSRKSLQFFTCVVFCLQMKEAERPKVEAVQQEEEEIIHEDNEWGQQKLWFF